MDRSSLAAAFGPRIELDAERNDQLIVADTLTAPRDDSVDRGLDGSDGVADPVRAPRDDVRLLAARAALGNHARADQRPDGLVEVILRRLNDRDIEPRVRPKQASRDRDAGRPSAQDQDLVITMLFVSCMAAQLRIACATTSKPPPLPRFGSFSLHAERGGRLR